MKTRIKNLLPLLLLLGLPGVVQAQDAYSTNADGSIYTYSTNADGSANIVACAPGTPFLTIPANINGLTVTTIGDSAFENCYNLRTVTIPKGVTSIGDDAFFACFDLASPTIPDSVTNIGTFAFDFCDSLTSITIPGGVTSIGEGAFLTPVLTNISVSDVNPAYSSLNGVLFNKAKDTLVQYPEALRNNAYIIPGTVTSIADIAFDGCTYLASVSIPGNVTSIGEAAFQGCSSLTSITIPNSVTNIGNNAFDFCSGLTNVTICNSATSIGDFAFEYCTSLADINLGTNVTGIGANAFSSLPYRNVITGDPLRNVTIPNSVTSIGDSAFSSCGYLTNVTIGNSVTNIGDDAFYFCYSLNNITIPNSVTTIGTEAFFNCGLTSISIPNNVTNIGFGAFANCFGLTNVTIPNSVTSLGEEAFANCSSLTSITIPNSVTSLGDDAFFGCSGLTSITIPHSVTSIGDEAFEYCSGLTSVTIPDSVTSIGVGVFEYCYSLTGVYFQGNSPTPTNDSTVFYGFFAGGSDATTVYYLPGTTGWGATFGGCPTAPWFLPSPVILNFEPGFGIQPGGFRFTISWATNASLVVQAATNLANPVWIPVSTNALISGTNYFSDPQWTNYPSRFYRIAGSFTVGGTLTGLPAGDTVTLQDNGSDNLTLSTNGAFTFPTPLPNGQAYSVTISGTGGGTSILTAIYEPVAANGSGTISGANVTNVAVQCTSVYTSNLDVDMYNAAVRDGTANGGVPGVMLTQNGGPFRVTAAYYAENSIAIAEIYSGRCVFTTVVGTGSCSSTTFPNGTPVIQFGGPLECGLSFYGY